MVIRKSDLFVDLCNMLDKPLGSTMGTWNALLARNLAVEVGVVARQQCTPLKTLIHRTPQGSRRTRSDFISIPWFSTCGYNNAGSLMPLKGSNTTSSQECKMHGCKQMNPLFTGLISPHKASQLAPRGKADVRTVRELSFIGGAGLVSYWLLRWYKNVPGNTREIRNGWSCQKYPAGGI